VVPRPEICSAWLRLLSEVEKAARMTINSISFRLDLPNLIAGLILGFVAGYLAAYLAHATYDWRQASAKARILHEKYGKLARSYSNFRADGTATGGSVELVQRPDGSFEVTGLNADRTVDWESVLWMDEKFDNVGTARYRHKVGVGYGIQIVRYIPEQDMMHVRGVRESGGPPLEFVHTWRPRK